MRRILMSDHTDYDGTGWIDFVEVAEGEENDDR